VFFWEFSPDLIAMLIAMLVVGGLGAFTVTYPLCVCASALRTEPHTHLVASHHA
jgi:hypothetical protein